MISKHELEHLASLMLQNEKYISLYLNVDPRDNAKDQWLTHFKNLSRSSLADLPAAEKSIVKKDLEKIEKHLSDRPEGMKRGLAIISCVAHDFWRIYHTALPFNNQLVIDHNPYIKPLAAMCDLYQRYLVVVVGASKARLLLTCMGEIEEITSIYRPPDEIDSGKDGSSGYMTELRAQKEKAKSIRIVYKDAVTAAEQVLAEEGIKRMILGGTDKGRSLFKEFVSASINERIVAEFNVDRKASNREILKQILPVMERVEFEFERKALDELFEQNRKTVLGLSDVLTALQQGNVHKMYVLAQVTAPGNVCNQCEALTPERERNCPYCGGEMREVPFMLDIAIQKAINQGARVDMLENAPRLEKAGGIGALLRY